MGLTHLRGNMMVGQMMGGGAAPSYSDIVLGVLPANLISYLPMDETSGATFADATGNGRTASISGVTLGAGTGPFGGPAPLWDGVNDFADWYTASLAAAFNGSELSFQSWIKVSGAGVWSDTTVRRAFVLRVNASNQVVLTKRATDGRFDVSYYAGGTEKTVAITGLSSTGWLHLVLTVSKSNDRVRVYLNGSQTGPTLTGLGTWAGTLASGGVLIGSETNTPTFAWSGYLNHAALWTTELTAANVTTLYNNGPTS